MLALSAFDMKHGHCTVLCGVVVPVALGVLLLAELLELDFESIWNDQDQFVKKQTAAVISLDFRQMKMAARGLSSLSDEIKQKLVDNQFAHE